MNYETNRTERELQQLDERIDRLERHVLQIDARVDRLKEILDEIRDDTRWTRRTLITALVGSSFTGVISLFVWLVQR